MTRLEKLLKENPILNNQIDIEMFAIEKGTNNIRLCHQLLCSECECNKQYKVGEDEDGTDIYEEECDTSVIENWLKEEAEENEA